MSNTHKFSEKRSQSAIIYICNTRFRYNNRINIYKKKKYLFFSLLQFFFFGGKCLVFLLFVGVYWLFFFFFGCFCVVYVVFLLGLMRIFFLLSRMSIRFYLHYFAHRTKIIIGDSIRGAYVFALNLVFLKVFFHFFLKCFKSLFSVSTFFRCLI